MNILVISGHGGKPYDPGAAGNRQEEAILTRELALLVMKELKNVKGVKPVLYDQRNDAYKVLQNGGSLPLSGVNYVLEIHFNSSANDPAGDGRTTGTEVLVHTRENGIAVEQAICRRISALGFENRGVRRRSDLLVMNVVNKQGISHALVETCFIDDADDMKLYLKVKPEIAQAIAAGIAEGFGLLYEEEDDMTQAEVEKIVRASAKTAFNSIYNAENPKYTSIEQVPEYWREEVREMIKYGAINGDNSSNISIRREALQAAVIAFRAAKQMDK